MIFGAQTRGTQKGATCPRPVHHENPATENTHPRINNSHAMIATASSVH